MLWSSLLVLVSFLPPSWEMSVAASTPCTAGSYRPGFLFVLSSHNFWISTVQYFQTHPSTFFVFYIFYVAYFIATPTLGLLNTITLQWLLLGEVATWTATEFPYCWCRSVSSPRSVACRMDASGSILLPHLHPSRQLHLYKPQREPTYAVTGIETLGIHHKSTTMSKSFVQKCAVGTWSCCTNLHLTCLIKPLSYAIDLSLQ